MKASRAIYNVSNLRLHKNILALRVLYFCNTCVGVSKWKLDAEENRCKVLSASEAKFMRTAGVMLMHPTKWGYLRRTENLINNQTKKVPNCLEATYKKNEREHNTKTD
jgi:hypothetical protein